MPSPKANFLENLRDLESGFGLPSQIAIVGVLVLVVLAIRLATIGHPTLEWTAWKEIDYIYISQNYATNGFDFFHPAVSWPAEPPRVTEMEFPLVPFLTAAFYKIFGFNVYSVRLLTLLAFLLLMIFVFKLVKRELGSFTAIMASFAVGVLPLFHPFGKFLYTEPTMIAMSVISLFYFAEWIDFHRRKDCVLALISISLTFALKIETLYLMLPIFWIAFRRYRFDFKEYVKPGILLTVGLVLPVLWYSYAYYLEMTGAHVFGIFAGHNKLQTFTMLADFRWYRLIAERIVYDILGGRYGTLLFLAGLVTSALLRRGGLFFAYLISIGAYFAIVAEGNIDAPYRQLTLVPAAGIFVACGATTIATCLLFAYKYWIKNYALRTASAIALASGLFLIAWIPFSHRDGIFIENAPRNKQRWGIAQQIRQYANADTKLVILGEYTKHVGGYDLSPVLYYYSGLQGWTLTPKDWNLARIEQLRAKGGNLLIIVQPYETEPVMYQPEESPKALMDLLKTRFRILSEDENSTIYDLNDPLL